MHDPEISISDYIDKLNAEQQPEAHRETPVSAEMEKLYATARLVRSLKEPTLPQAGYPQRLAQKVVGRKYAPDSSLPLHKKYRSMAAIAAGLLILLAVVSWTGLFKQDAASAMAKAVAQVDNYHGILEMRSQNQAGEVWMVRQIEIWSSRDKYALQTMDGTLTVNNGEKKWQVRDKNKEVAILPLLPDLTGQNFDLQDEASKAVKYSHHAVGEENVAGRPATKLEISPPGGLIYYLWVDDETHIPIQLQTAMQNSLQTTYTFINFEPNIGIDPGVFTYQVPAGYQVSEENPGQLVASVEEAAAISSLDLILPKTAPNRILAFKDQVVLDYGDTTITETVAQDTWELTPNAAMGKVGGGPLEIWGERLRWRQDGLEIQVEGPQRLALSQQITPDILLPDAGANLTNKAQVKVPVDMEIVRNNQQQVDRGSSPWQLDPMQVAHTFANLQISPQFIEGEPRLPMTDFKITANNGVDSLVQISQGPIKNIYLKRLIRQDESGIWTVVGYDPR